ncbi:MAG TPA: Hsp20/alpha crystallin family protein [bacterium]|nr:Hsp20/alpha crystallin family protein [bacterium]
MAEKAVQKMESQEVERVERTRSGRTFLPPTDIIETESEIILLADMPGVDEKTVDIILENKLLTIQGNVETRDDNNLQTVYAEFESGDYYRAFTLSDDIDRERIQAKLKNGVLKLVLPKAETAKSRKIAVHTGE